MVEAINHNAATATGTVVTKAGDGFLKGAFFSAGLPSLLAGGAAAFAAGAAVAAAGPLVIAGAAVVAGLAVTATVGALLAPVGLGVGLGNAGLQTYKGVEQVGQEKKQFVGKVNEQTRAVQAGMQQISTNARIAGYEEGVNESRQQGMQEGFQQGVQYAVGEIQRRQAQQQAVVGPHTEALARERAAAETGVTPGGR